MIRKKTTSATAAESMGKKVLRKAASGRRWADLIYHIAIYILLFDLAFVFLYPFFHMIVNSLKSPQDLIDITVKIIPTSFYWKNYKIAFSALNYAQAAKNSLLITLFTTSGHILACSFIAYGFARFKFPGRELFFMIVLFSMIVPIQVLIFPYYMQFSDWGWLNTYLPLIVPTFFGFGLRGGLYIFIFRQFFMGLPYELEEAAKIDGCSAFRTYWNIVLPVSKSSTLVAGVLSMVWHWNDCFEPGIYLTKQKLWPVPINIPTMYETLKALSSGQADEFMTEGEVLFNEGVVFAGTFLVILPIIIIYLILQRQFMEGIERTGIVG
jgi:multiple sugar transport system permease protein